MNEQAVLSNFYAARDASERLRAEDLARPACSLRGVVERIVKADRAHALRLLAAANKALAKIAPRKIAG